jgi:predicted amidohydrolase YtcJ
LAVHAIGDRANQMVIEQFHKLRHWEQANQITGMRHRIEHLQTCQPADLTRMAGLNVVASVQPIHLPSDITAADNSLGDRAQFTYSFRSMENLSIPMVFGSDAPVEHPDVLMGIHAAVKRTRLDGTPKGGWQPKETLTLNSAIEAFTSSAHQLFPINGATLGKLSPGFLADLIALNRDPFTTPTDSINDIQVMKTMIDGEWVWEI